MKYVLGFLVGVLAMHLATCFGSYTWTPDFGSWQVVDRVSYLCLLVAGGVIGLAMASAFEELK